VNINTDEQTRDFHTEFSVCNYRAARRYSSQAR